MVRKKVSTENSLVPCMTKKGTWDKGTKVIFQMNKVSINKDMHLSEHFQLGEVTKTSVKTADGNIPSHVAIENLKNLCENWLEDLRYSYNTLYPSCHREGTPVMSSAPSVMSSGVERSLLFLSFRAESRNPMRSLHALRLVEMTKVGVVEMTKRRMVEMTRGRSPLLFHRVIARRR